MENNVQSTAKIIEKLTEAENRSNVSTPNRFDPNSARKKKAIWSYVAKAIILLFTLFAFARVPFVGSYLDGLFDYVMGFGKYIFYCLVIFILIGWTFNTGYTRIVRSGRFFFFAFIALLSACCIVSATTSLIYGTTDPIPFVQGMSDYHSHWKEYFINWHYSGFFNMYVTGGILAELVAYIFTYLSCVMLLILAAIILIICILVIFNINYKSTRVGLRLRKWMIKKLGGSFKYDGYNELKSKRDNQNRFKRKSRVEVEASALQSSSLPFNLLPQTDVNKFDANFKYARSIQNRLATLFRNSDIDCVPTDINVYLAYSDVCFEAKNKSQVQEIIKLQKKIAKTAKIDHFNISMRGNIVNIEIENIFFSKVSLRTAFELYKDGKDITAVFGLDKDNNLAIQNFRNSPSALILGKKGSGAATLTVLMALSTCYITSPDDLELVVLNPNCEATYSAFNNLPHSSDTVYESLNGCTEKLHNIQNEVNERNSLLKVNRVDNIDQYNKSVSKTQPKFKHILVLIGNVDSILRESFQNNKVLNDILTNGPRAGVYLIMQSYTVNNDILDKQIFDAVTDKYILALGSQEESLKIFDNYRGYQLHGNGDCLHFGGNKLTTLERLQICNLNYTELTTDIDVMKTFYISKVKQKEERIIMEVSKDEENR